jgi:hypothetical protein
MRVAALSHRLCLLCLSLCLGTACSTAGSKGVTSVASALYTRVDSNATTVWAPRTSLGARVSDAVSVQAAVAIDAWTGASIDVTTAATDAIHEVRKEVTAGSSYELSNATLSAGYRYSSESDYWSNGGVLSASIDMAANNTTLDLAAFGSLDTVGRSGDPGFDRPQQSIGGRVSLTQILSTKSVAQLSWETTRVSGYQAGPYRFVAINGQGLCAGSGPYCVPEVVPSLRLRNAAVARLRRAIGERVSVGGEYRFYVDDWGLTSHTVAPDLALLVGEHGTLSASYRYYTQSEADFYRPRYVNEGTVPRYVTRDRELSALYSNRIGIGYLHEFEVDDGNALLTAAFRAGVTRYHYLAFVGLEDVNALETTFLLSLGFR